MMKAVLHGSVLAAGLVAAILAVLAGAEAGMVNSETVKRCRLAFPQWVGCALANHENLAGGLIGAGGAIFAGWLAWRSAMRQLAAAELPSMLSVHDRALRQVYALVFVKEYVTALLEKCGVESAHDRRELIATVQKVYDEGGLAQPVMPQASRENGLRVELALRALREVASRADYLQKNSAADVIDRRLDDLRRVLDDVNAELDLARVQVAAAEAQIRGRGYKVS